MDSEEHTHVGRGHSWLVCVRMFLLENFENKCYFGPKTLGLGGGGGEKEVLFGSNRGLNICCVSNLSLISKPVEHYPKGAL